VLEAVYAADPLAVSGKGHSVIFGWLSRRRADTEPRPYEVEVVFTDEQWPAIRRAARADRMRVGDWVRQAGLSAAERALPAV
jgi:hypothetical protein